VSRVTLPYVATSGFLTLCPDVRKYVIRRKIEKEGKKPYTKAPRIQRLVTPQVLQRKRQRCGLLLLLVFCLTRLL
jgi:hypothetical protein